MGLKLGRVTPDKWTNSSSHNVREKKRQVSRLADYGFLLARVSLEQIKSWIMITWLVRAEQISTFFSKLYQALPCLDFFFR